MTELPLADRGDRIRGVPHRESTIALATGRAPLDLRMANRSKLFGVMHVVVCFNGERFALDRMSRYWLDR